MNQNKKPNTPRKRVHLAVATALPILLLAGNVHADCTTGNASSDANTIICTEGSTYSNATSTSIENTATISTAGSTSSVLQMSGNSNTFTNNGTLTNSSVYSNTATNMGQKYGAYIGAGTATTESANVMTNKGAIGATISSQNMYDNKARVNTGSVVGLGTDVSGEYELTNSGTISATHNGIGRVNGVEAGGDVEEIVINNSGSITGTRVNPITRTTSIATSFQGTVTGTANSGGYTSSAANIGVATGVYAEEEVFGLTVNNTGTITGVGDYASGIYTRAVETTITNSGTITGSDIGVAQVSDGGEIRTMTLINSGTINGDILSVNGAALRWWSLSNGEATAGVGTDIRLNINSQYGQADSDITNSGAINGNFYYSNGTHILNNEDGGSITGNIDIDQRNTYNSIAGTKSFTFENAGNFAGDITIRTASTTTTSNIMLVPTVTGSGAGFSENNPSANISGMGSTLKIWDGASSTANLATVAPKLTAVVHTGEWFKIADALYGSTLPEISSQNTALVTWEIAKNTGGNLVIGVESVATPSSIGITGRSVNALNTLLGYAGDNDGLNQLGGKILNMLAAEDISNAAEQLRPEVNGANIQAAMGMADKVFGLVDSHLGETHLASLTGRSGIATGEQPNGTGVWIQGFGFRGDQDKRKSVDGYTADAYGFAFGADTLVSKGDLRIGAAFSYGQSNIDDKGVNNGNKTDIDSYQATLYGSMLMDGWYLNGTLGLGKHNYDSKRIVLTNVVKGSHDAWQYTAKVDAGWPLKVGLATITPVAALTYSRLNQDGYSESGVGALDIDSNDTNSFRSGLGAKALIPLREGAVNTGLELRAIWSHEFADTVQDTTARFVGGGSSFTTSGVDPSRDSANLGASLRLSGGDKDVQQSLLLSYDAEIKNQYLSHTAQLQARFDF